MHLVRSIAALLCASAAACARTTTASAPEPANGLPGAHTEVARVVFGDSAAIARARADSAQKPYTVHDVKFMQGMIGHHGQAIEMARLVPSRTSTPSIRTLAGRIINAQQDEIVLMQQWLADRLQQVPQVHPTAHMAHEGHAMMPGMLTPEQLRQLESARGAAFDRLFLTYMIQHHQGAVTMVSQLFSTYGSGVNDTVFKLASDVNVDQTTEIARMERMLADLTNTQRDQQ